MKIKFVNGTMKECTAPTEQMVFKTKNGETLSAGWVLLLKLIGAVTSEELDTLFAEDNIKTLAFYAGEDLKFSLTGYDKVTSSVIRYSEDADAVCAEIQFSKGV